MAASAEARIDFRTTAAHKAMIEKAAAMTHTTVSEFLKTVALEKSLEIIDAYEKRVLSDRDRDVFLAVLDAPASPNAALREAASRFQKAVVTGELIP